MVWKHSNVKFQFSDDWEWGDDPEQDLDDSIGNLPRAWSMGTSPEALKDLKLPEQWAMISYGGAAIDATEAELSSTENENLERFELIQDSTVPWERPSYEENTVVPFRFDPVRWAEIGADEKLEVLGVTPADGLRSDGVLFSTFDTHYFDFYISGYIFVEINIDAPTRAAARDLASQELKVFIDSELVGALLNVLPKFTGDPNFDESIELYRIPNWVYLEM